MYRLKKNELSVLTKVQGVGCNRTQNRTNTKGGDPNKSYVEGINNIESCIFKKSKDKITRDDQDWYW